jgi:hypothetical protein
MNPKLKHRVAPVQSSLQTNLQLGLHTGLHTRLSTTLEAKPSGHSISSYTQLSYTISGVPSSFSVPILHQPHTLKDRSQHNRSRYLKPRLEPQGFWTVITGGSGDLCGTPDNICPTFTLFAEHPSR